MFGTRRHLSAPFLGLAILALSTFAHAKEVFTITATFADTDPYGLAEFSARLDLCTGPDVFKALGNELKAECVSKLVSQSATCSVTLSGAFVCVIDGVSVNTVDMEFSCGTGGCPSSNAETKAVMDLAAGCDAAGNRVDVTGFVSGTCFTSGYCMTQSPEPTSTSFGDFCPSATGEYCCSPNAARTPDGIFPVSDRLLPTGGLDLYRRIDHAANMDIKIFYEVEAPARLQLKVEVPYIQAESALTYTENGTSITTLMCPTSYMIDFEPPVETVPDGFVADPSSLTRPEWLPLSHFPDDDKLGHPRSTCGNYDMSYSGSSAFVSGFNFPTGSAGDTSFTYGDVPAVATNADGTQVWDTSQGTVGIPHGAVTFWNKGAAIGDAGDKRLNYTVGEGENGYFDLVKAWTKCKNIKDNKQLVSKQPNTDDVVINGVSYPVETYEWTLSVCAVGYFGKNCNSRTDTQMYAKTCRNIPASFSVTPQQIAHVTVSPITEALVSKTFLQTVTAFSSDCSELHERVAVTLNLVMFGTDYEIASSKIHDLVSPLNVFETADAMEDFVVTESAQATFADHLAAVAAASGNVGEGVVVLAKNTVISGSVTVYSRKIIIVSKCYKTEWNSAEGTRANPDVFAEAITDTAGNVLVDLEIIVEKTNVVVDGVAQDLTGSGKIMNTLNLRILATKETFILPTANKLKQKDVTAYQKLYGQYNTAKLDTNVGLVNALPDNAVLEGGGQLCSKHQLIEYDAQTANLLPNAVGACMLKKSVATDPKWNALKGTTIKYRTTGMTESADYTYGCFPDWIDTTAATLGSDGVYLFTGPVPRFAGAFDSMFWFVQKQGLETTEKIANEFMSDRFATALFWYNTTGGPAGGGKYVVTKSPRFETAQLNFDVNPAGCVGTSGAMKSSCNMACFDLVDGLLTDPQSIDAREVLVHHVSVAVVASEVDSVPGNKFAAAKKHRRILLQSVSSTDQGSESLASATATLKVNAAVRNVRDVREAALESETRGKIEGPKSYETIFFPVTFPLIFLVVFVGGSIFTYRRYKEHTNIVRFSKLNNAYEGALNMAQNPSSAFKRTSTSMREPLLDRSPPIRG